MSWTRPLSLALAFLALAPGLSQAQIASWAQLSLPVLFGQETPAGPALSERQLQQLLVGLRGSSSEESDRFAETASQPAADWTPPAPTPTREYATLWELITSSWRDLSSRTETPATTASTLVDECPPARPCNEVRASMNCRSCDWWVALCPASFRPYLKASQAAMVALGGQNVCSEKCPTASSSGNPRYGCEEAAGFATWCPFASQNTASTPCTRSQTTTRVVRGGPIEVEITWGGAKEGCATPECGHNISNTRNVIRRVVAACLPCAPVCGEAGVQCHEIPCVGVTGSGFCPLVPAAVDCCCKEKVVAGKKCGCGKDCACCTCKKAVVDMKLIREIHSFLESVRRNQDEVCPIVRHGMGFPHFHPGEMHPHGMVALPPPPPPFFLPLPPPPPMVMPAPGRHIVVSGRSEPRNVVEGRPVSMKREMSPAPVKIQTPHFDAVCESISPTGNPDEMVLTGNVQVTMKNGVLCTVSAERVVVNVRRGTIHTGGPGVISSSEVLAPAGYEIINAPPGFPSMPYCEPARPGSVQPTSGTAPLPPGFRNSLERR